MKDSEKNERISNLKNIMNNVKEDSNKNELEEEKFHSPFEKELDKENTDFTNEKKSKAQEDGFTPKFKSKIGKKSDETEINDEFIYKPSDDSNENIEEETLIDEKFMVKPNKKNECFQELDFSEDEDGDINSIKNNFKDDIDSSKEEEIIEDNTDSPKEEEIIKDKDNTDSPKEEEIIENKDNTDSPKEEEIIENKDNTDSPKEDKDNKKEKESEFEYNQIDNILNYKLGKIHLIAFLGIILGIIFILISALMFFGSSDRVVDNVISGEVNVSGIFFLLIGIIIIIFSIFKAFSLKNPFGDLASSMDKLETNNQNKKNKKNKTSEILKEPPIDREKYKIGEFDLKTLELTKPAQKTESTKTKDTPPKEEIIEEKEEITEKTEVKENNIESKSIDDIFSDLEEVEDLDESIPIVSVDEKINSSKKKEE